MLAGPRQGPDDAFLVPSAGEFAHLHPGYDGSLHLALPLALATDVIAKGWGVAHPLARSWVELEAANLMAFKAAALYDAGRDCGAEANAAKYLGGEAGFNACEAAVLAHGGMGYAKEYDVERYFREVMIARIAPISREMVLNYIAERVLGLPKSY